jgi:hypothetical protein
VLRESRLQQGLHVRRLLSLMAVEWQDTGLRANQVLTMIAAILIDRAGGSVTFTNDEWKALNVKYGGTAAVLFAEPESGSFEAFIDTTGSVSQGGAQA